MTYAKVISNEITEYNRTLPFSTDTTSFGVGTSAETLKEFGYLPIVGGEPEYDRLTHKIGNVSYAIGTDDIIKTYEVVELTVEEIRERDVPTMLTPRQCRLQLLAIGLLDEVETLLIGNKAMQIWWEYSLDIQRNHEHIIAMGSALGLTELQLDDLFIDGAKL